MNFVGDTVKPMALMGTQDLRTQGDGLKVAHKSEVEGGGRFGSEQFITRRNRLGLTPAGHLFSCTLSLQCGLTLLWRGGVCLSMESGRDCVSRESNTT